MSISSFLLWPALGTAVSDHWGSIGSVLLKLLIIAALVALNGFFVACEFAIVKVRSSQLDTLEEEGHQRASLTKYIRAHLDAYFVRDPAWCHARESRAGVSRRTISRPNVAAVFCARWASIPMPS